MSYYQVSSFTTRLGEHTVQFISKPGLAYWDRVSPASLLLAGAVRLPAGARALLLGCGHGALGAALAHDADVTLMDASCIAVRMARRTLAANAVARARVLAAIDIPPEQAGTFDAVVIEAPSDRRLARRWLAQGRAALRPGGELYVAGANDQGIRSVIADTQALFGNAAVLAYKGGNRVAQARETPEPHAIPAWAVEPGIAPGTWCAFTAQVRGQIFPLRSLPGVFAYDRVDEGTRLLAETLDDPSGARVLDVGCGYGLIGLLAARLGAVEVDMVDASLLAVAAAGENIALNRAATARACACDGVPSAVVARYDVVATNPPFHVGKSVDYEVAHAFIAGARRALKPDGRFFLVANQFIRYDQLLRDAFERVACVAETRSYRVWRAS